MATSAGDGVRSVNACECKVTWEGSVASELYAVMQGEGANADDNADGDASDNCDVVGGAVGGVGMLLSFCFS